MDASKLGKGQRVRITFEGVVALHDLSSVSFRHPDGPSMPVSWSDRLKPKIEILDHGFRANDVGIWTSPSGRKQNVVFRRFAGDRGSDGWYSLLGGAFLSLPDSGEVELVLRGDGTKV